MMYKNRPTYDFYGVDGVGFGMRPYWGIQEYVMDSFQLRIRELEEKLQIATKALEQFKKREDGYLDYGIDENGNHIALHPNRVATKALKEIEEVKCGNNYIYVSGR